MTGLRALDASLQKTHEWLDDVDARLGLKDREKVYHLAKAVLQTLRDRLTVAEAADLAAQLPMIMRGFYYEGWRPAAGPVKMRTRGEFLEHVRRKLPADLRGLADPATNAVLLMLRDHVSQGELSDIQGILPDELRGEAGEA